jgi:hypothetical protein
VERVTGARFDVSGISGDGIVVPFVRSATRPIIGA